MGSRHWTLFISSSSDLTLFKSQQHQRVVCKTLSQRRRQWSDSGPNEISCAKSTIILGGDNNLLKISVNPHFRKSKPQESREDQILWKAQIWGKYHVRGHIFQPSRSWFLFCQCSKEILFERCKIYSHTGIYVKKIVGVCIAFISETQSFGATLTQFLSEWKSLWWRYLKMENTSSL